MPRGEEKDNNLAIQCKGREARIMNHAWSRSSEKGSPSLVKGRLNEGDLLFMLTTATIINLRSDTEKKTTNFDFQHFLL